MFQELKGDAQNLNVLQLIQLEHEKMFAQLSNSRALRFEDFISD